MSKVNRENLFKALGLFIEQIREYAVFKLVSEVGDKWPASYVEALLPPIDENWRLGLKNGTPPKNLIDFGNLSSFAIKYKRLTKKEFGKHAHDLPTWFNKIKEVRNKCNHFDEKLPSDDVFVAYVHMADILKAIGESEIAQELLNLRDEKFSLQKTSEKVIEPAVKGSLIPWFKNVKPHHDVQKGILDESIFAANLGEVSRGTGRPIYQNPGVFFSKTYFTSGLKAVAKRVIQGLNGGAEAENRVVSLQTGFGGGKTHSLITLYHLAEMGKAVLEVESIQDLIRHTGKPKFNKANVAVFTNTTNDPLQGREVEDIHLRTLWGELAWQLGGKSAYELIKANDQERTAPKGLFKNVLEKCRPSLILIDELADYCVAASGVSVGASSLADQTISFIQELSEAGSFNR